MNDCLCHLCGEAMEVDVLMMLGDTCELCMLAAIPAHLPVEFVATMELMLAAVLAHAEVVAS